MFFKESNIFKTFLILAGLTVLLHETFILFELFELFLGQFATVKDIAEIGIWENLSFVGSKLIKLFRYHDLVGFVLN